MPDYKKNDPRGWCGDPKRGAALGRPSIHADRSYSGTIKVQRVWLDGDYDVLGTYWGGGEGTSPLYWTANEDDEHEIDYCLRAKNFDAALADVRKLYPRATVEVDLSNGLDGMLQAYVECAIFASRDDDEGELDERFDASDLAPEALAEMRDDCEKFLAANKADIGDAFDDAGHDFWLTRNGHGCGFWDGDWPDDVGKRLTEASKAFGECCMYVGDDDKLYVS